MTPTPGSICTTDDVSERWKLPEWLTIVSPLGACAAILMALRLIFRERRTDQLKAAAERAAERDKLAADSERRGASNADLAQGMAALRAALTGMTLEIGGLKTLATEVLKVGIELAHVKAAIDDIRTDMKLMADAERVHTTLDDLDRRMRDVEQHMAKWSGKFFASPPGKAP